MSLMAPEASVEEWWTRIELIRDAWHAHSRMAADFASSFTSTRSAERIMELIARAAERKKILTGQQH
jgi:hypothetical protein